MLLYFILFIPPILYAFSNILDKHLVHEGDEYSTPEILVVVGGIFNLLIVFLFLLYYFITSKSFYIDPYLFLNGAIFTLAIWIYLKLLFYDDVEKVAPWYQTIPIFGLFGGMIFLGEMLGWYQIVGVLLVVFGGLFLIRKGKKIDYKILAGMLISSLLIAGNDVILAYFGRPISVDVVLFSDVLGKSFFALLPLLMFSVRKNIVHTLRDKFSIQSVNEMIFIIADLILDYGKLIFPVVLVQSFASTQPLFLIIGVYLLMKFKPNFLKQNESMKHFRKNLVFIVLIVIGGILILYN